MKEKCLKCNDQNWYQYSGFTGGTPHSKVCEICCTHEGTPWQSQEGKWYCKAGCGEEMEEPIVIFGEPLRKKNP